MTTHQLWQHCNDIFLQETTAQQASAMLGAIKGQGMSWLKNIKDKTNAMAQTVQVSKLSQFQEHFVVFRGTYMYHAYALNQVTILKYEHVRRN